MIKETFYVKIKEGNMNRLTEKCWRNLNPWETCGQDNHCTRGCHEEGGCTKGCKSTKKLFKIS